MITKEQTNLIRTGFGHMVDNGYGPIETVAQVILVLEVQLECARREKQISLRDGLDSAGADTMISFLESLIANLTARTGR